MHRAAVLLACVCSVYANSLQHSFFGPASQSTPQDYQISSLSTYPGDLKYPVSRTLPSYNPYSRYEHSYHQYPSELAEQTNDSLQDVSSLVELLVPLSLDSTDFRNPQTPWSAPSLRKALEDLDKGYTTVKEHFTKAAFAGKDDKKFRYIVIVHVVDQLSRDVAQNGWYNYNKNYKGVVTKYIQESLADPKAAASAFVCAVQPGLEAIKPVRRLIEHPVVRYVCKAQPTSCDSIIWSLLQYNSVTRHATDVLLTAGSAATIFLNNYSTVFEAMSGQNVLKYLLEQQEQLRWLVSKNVNALKNINNLDQNCKGPY